MAEASVVGVAAGEPGRRVVRLDEMSDAEIDEMVAAAILPELRYGLGDIPDRP